LTVQLDDRALLFTAGLSILSVFLFGLAPALQSTRPDLIPALKAIDAVTSKQVRPWGRTLLVGGQIALSVVLLIVSAVLVEGFRADLLRGPGFRFERIFLASFNTTLVRYSAGRRDQFYRRLLDKARLAPGVDSAVLASAVPITVGGSMIGLVPEGYRLQPGQESITVFDSVVSDGFFETLGIPVVQGRSILESDNANTRPVAVVNEQFAKHYWPNQSPLGKTFRLQNATGKLVEIVGVAKTTKYLTVSESPLDFVYLPFTQNPQPQMTLVAKARSSDATILAPVLRRVVQELDKNMPTFDTRSMKDVYENRTTKAFQVVSEIIVTLGAVGLLLAVIGLYGLIAYSVSRRTREIGIRMAIGADRLNVVTMVLEQGLILGIVGVGVGLVIGLFACRAINSIQFLNLGRPDVLVFAGVSVLLLLTTTGASYLPAWRASHIDPIRALRDE
jgi:predicted permease